MPSFGSRIRKFPPSISQAAQLAARDWENMLIVRQLLDPFMVLTGYPTVCYSSIYRDSSASTWTHI